MRRRGEQLGTPEMATRLARRLRIDHGVARRCRAASAARPAGVTDRDTCDAASVEHLVVPVALLERQWVGHPVAARRDGAVGVAQGRGVSVVAGFRTLVDHAISADRDCAGGCAGSVVSIAVSEVALLSALDDTIPAIGYRGVTTGRLRVRGTTRGRTRLRLGRVRHTRRIDFARRGVDIVRCDLARRLRIETRRAKGQDTKGRHLQRAHAQSHRARTESAVGAIRGRAAPKSRPAARRRPVHG